MKTKKEHLVPLTNTVVKNINEMKDISYGVSKYVFPSRISNLKVRSENTLNFALTRLGFDVTAQYIDERIALMQWWSDYLDVLKISK